jgi:hypothetical protein
MIHPGTTSEHSEIQALPEHTGMFRYCPVCNGWFYRTTEQASMLKPIADMSEDEFNAMMKWRAQ